TDVNSAGEYRFSPIPAGRYILEFSARGFKRATTDAAVAAGKVANANVTLDLGAISESVVVVGKRTAPLPQAPPPQRIRVGGNVQASRLLRQTRPQYPAQLQQLGVEGAVLMQAVIGIDGSLLNLKVINNANPDLANAAMDAARQWRYQPTLLNGQPVEV